MGATGPAGAQGDAGVDGADGQLRIYGDGSAGNLTVTADTDWTTTPPLGGNFQFQNVTINAGVVLTVDSGTTIRCLGTFTNNGTITVSSATLGGFAVVIDGVGLGRVLEAGPGAGSGRSAGRGVVTLSGSAALGGRGGDGLRRSAAQLLLSPGLLGGSGGAGIGGQGGGALRVFSRGALTNGVMGTISAVGTSPVTTTPGGGGGGGGGIVILASKTQVTQAGTINVSGGNGGAAGLYFAPGGGGGGGIVHLLAPSIGRPGQESTLGGQPGTGTGALSAATWIGGSGGGSCAGSGGFGADVATNGTFSGATAGGVGFVFESQFDPTAQLN